MGNYATNIELQGLSTIVEKLNSLQETLDNSGIMLSFGRITVVDSNGERIAVIDKREGAYSVILIP